MLTVELAHTHTHTHTHTPFFMGFFLMGRGIYIGISPTEQEESAACAVCLGSHAARGDYGGCDSATVARLGLHAAHSGRGACSSARTMRVVVVARLARCARSGRCN